MDADNKHLSACALIDGDGYQAQSNGDIIRAYQSTLWMYLDALATELVEAKNRIIAMLDQMSIKTADNEWLDEWGEYFGVLRAASEPDADYANRIIAEVIRPRGNNKAIESALFQQFGQVVNVTDVVKWGSPSPAYNGVNTHNSAVNYNASATPKYGLFEIIIGYDLLTSGDPPAFTQGVRDFVEKIRDAGTHLDSVNLSGSLLSDAYSTPPVDSGLDFTVTDQAHYDSLRYHNGGAYYGAVVTNESL
jgi:hypothetical protein